jgi:hypothetical protein
MLIHNALHVRGETLIPKAGELGKDTQKQRLPIDEINFNPRFLILFLHLLSIQTRKKFYGISRFGAPNEHHFYVSNLLNLQPDNEGLNPLAPTILGRKPFLNFRPFSSPQMFALSFRSQDRSLAQSF